MITRKKANFSKFYRLKKSFFKKNEFLEVPYIFKGAGTLGHGDVKATMIYTYVLNRGGLGVKSSVDTL